MFHGESTSAALAASCRTDFDLMRLTHLVEERAAAHNATITDLLERLDLRDLRIRHC